MSNNAVIYGLKRNNEFYYIGKTSKRKANGDLKVSDAKYQYTNQQIRNMILIDQNNVEIVNLKDVNPNEWYDKKLVEVVAKHGEHHPLLNAQWMKDGKRGYWEGKTRDKFTLKRLSESKFKKVVQYDMDGIFVKLWDSGKDVGTDVFGDYRVSKGSAESQIYRLLSSRLIQNKFADDSYWFKYDELIQKFGGLPMRIDINNYIVEYRKVAQTVRKPRTTPKAVTTYTIIECDTYFNLIRKYNDAEEAAKKLKITTDSVRRACRTMQPLSNNRLLMYCEKTTKIPEQQLATA